MKKYIIAISLIWLVVVTLQAEEESLKRAWKCFNIKQYDSAMIYATDCIDDFSEEALRLQEEWLANNESCPPDGKVNDIMKNRIFNNSLLNDVATAYWILASSAKVLYDTGQEEYMEYLEIAIHFCEESINFKCGRCWDKRGWFWSPVDKCQTRLKSYRAELNN